MNWPNTVERNEIEFQATVNKAMEFMAIQDLKSMQIQCISNSCNTGMRDLPDSYVCLKPEVRGHTYQANHERPCYKYYVSPLALLKSPKLTVGCSVYL